MSQSMSLSPTEAADQFARQYSTPEALLDFAPESLRAVERLVSHLLAASDDEAGDEAGDGADMQDGADVLVRASCYVGEVIRRALGGHWAAAGGGADMLRDVAGRTGEAGVVIPLSELMLIASTPSHSLLAWYDALASNRRVEI